VANYLLAAGGTLDGSFPWSITGMASSTSSETAVATAWAAAMTTLFTTAAYKAFLPAMTECTYASASTADAEFRQTTKTTETLALSGTASTVATTFQTASIVSLDTAYATRWGRGRWYLPGPNDTGLAAAGYFFSAAYTTALAAAVTSALTTFNATAQLQIAHRKASKSGPAAYTLTAVTGGTVSDMPATQRRRADKRLPIRTSWAL